jgi:cytochrome c5
MSNGSRFGVVVVAATLVAGLAVAAGNETKGKFYFKKSCKTCHAKGGEGGEVTPLSKTQEQWKRYFDKGTHKKGSQKLTDVVPAEQLVDMQSFLVNHAVDSPQPETCG